MSTINKLGGLSALRRSRYAGDPDTLVRMQRRMETLKTDPTQTRPPTVDELDMAEDAAKRRERSLRR